MKTIQNYSLEALLLVTTAWMGILATIYEFTGVPLATHESSVLLDIFSHKTVAFTPAALMTDYNHLMIITAPLILIIGICGIWKHSIRTRKVFFHLEMGFWFFQTIGLIALGFYPLAASFTSIFFGVSFYLTLIKFWE